MGGNERTPPRHRWQAPSWAWLLVAVAVSLLLWLPFLDLPMISDEGGYAYVTTRWLAGQGHLYHDLWVSRPQGIFVVYALILHTLGTGVVALRLGAWLAAMATLLLVWRFARLSAENRVAIIAAFGFAILSGSPAIEGFTANAEVFMAVPATAAAVLLLRAGRGRWSAAPLLGAGVCAGLATLLKPSGIVMLGVGIAYVWLMEPEARLAMRRMALLLAGLVAALAPACIHGWLIGWHAFFYAAVTYRLTSQSGATAGLSHQLISIGALAGRCWPLLALTALLLLIRHGQWPRLAALRGGLDRELARSSRLGIVAPALVVRWRGDSATLLLRLWLLASLAGVVIGGDWWPHYLIQAAAPFAIWLAAAFVGAWDRLARMPRRGLAVLTLLALLSPYSVLAKGGDNAISQAIFAQPAYPSQNAVAAYLRQHDPTDATIFVAFDNPAIYYLADRPAAYPHLYDAELRAIPGTYGQLLDLINGSDRPRYVVGTKEHAPYPDRGRAFWAAVSRHYHLVDTVRGVPILREDDGLGRGR